MKILLAIRSLDFGGAERQWTLLAKELAKRNDIELHLCTLYGGGRLEYEIVGIPHTCLNKKGRGDLGFLLRYRKLLKEFRPDFIYSFMPEMNCFSVLCAAFLKAKVAFGLRSSGVNLRKLPFASKLYFYAQKFLSPFADVVICNSSDGVEFYKKCGFSAKKLRVVHNGIDTKRFCKKGQGFKKELGIPSDSFVFGISARMNFVKNYPLFAEVVKGFLESLEKEDLEKVAFVSLGKCDNAILKECLKILGNYQNKVLFLGAKNDVERYYPVFDCIVSTSSAESFSNSIAEGMACGCVPLVSNVGESRVIANFNQEDSYHFCFESGDKEMAILGFKELFALRDSKELESLKDKAREHIVNEFSVSKMLDNTLEILRSL
ncbi:MAG: glycosyltransferase [Helicobacteraceae bacterium]|nr:glycosyltransferase [Helicobacteraceae bacterium]